MDVADDILHCNLYLQEKTDDCNVMLVRIMAFVEGIIPNHLWHRDPFQLFLSHEQVIECIMRAGDSVDDEWLVVYLLWQISEKFNVIIRVYDADGDFLLIEAADVLPLWVHPDNSDARVWIHQGRLHLIPLEYTSTNRRTGRPSGGSLRKAESKSTLLEQDALELVVSKDHDTFAPTKVESVIRERISRYPEAAQSHIHQTKVYLPVDIARALHSMPFLIQRAIECFYTRDALQLRSAQKMARFPPSPSILTSVRMTKPAYAQLMGQRFNAPRVFHRPLDQMADEIRWWDNGVKIACGFEMLYQEARVRGGNNKSDTTVTEYLDSLESLQNNSPFRHYLRKLEEYGYFGHEIKDSQQWKAKEIAAVGSWYKMHEAKDSKRPSFSQGVELALKLAPHELPEDMDSGEDSDDWMAVDPAALDRSLETYTKKNREDDMKKEGNNAVDDAEATLADAQTKRLKSMVEKVDGFIKGQGNLEGAMFDDEMFSEEDSDDDLDDKKVRAEILESLVSPLDPGEYGKMPTQCTHSNSQRMAQSADTLTKTDSEHRAVTESDTRPSRDPILERDKYDGVDSDEETSEEEEGGAGVVTGGVDDEDQEDWPQVVGDVEVDMNEETEDFLSFTRDILGIDEQAWEGIIEDRKKRGVYVPEIVTKARGTGQRTEDKANPLKPNATNFFAQTENIAFSPRSNRTDTTNANPDLSSFEAVMDAMEKELGKLTKQPKASTKTRGGGASSLPNQKGKQKASIVEEDEIVEDEGEDEDDDIQKQMDEELEASLKREVAMGLSDDEGDDEEGAPMDYTLVKNFLESFKSQQGLSGPVSGLLGRLEGQQWTFPQDKDEF